jgi:hypothetical protein
MKLEVTREVDTTGWVLQAYLGDILETIDFQPFEFNEKEYENIGDLKKDYPALVKYNDYIGNPTIQLEIDINTGKVLNWPKGISQSFHTIKIVDTGYYRILDENGKEIVSYKGYVPDCLGEYGDYLEFDIDENGMIEDWRFDQSDFDEIKNNS